MTAPSTPNLPSSLTPGLYLVATPIGNLGDMTLRALEVLRGVDQILCEDTRVTGRLLKYFQIDRPLGVYNDQSEGRSMQGILDRLNSGQRIALVSDAGMPLMSDPGFQLVRACRLAGVMVTVIPGASAILSALALSGLPSDAFFFFGFLSTKRAERQGQLRRLADIPATLIFFERAERVYEMLSDVEATLGTRAVAVVREITKMFEETRWGLVDQVKNQIKINPIKGEVVVLVDRAGAAPALDETAIKQELLRRLQAGASLRQAVDDVGALYSLPRRTVYEWAIAVRDELD